MDAQETNLDFPDVIVGLGGAGKDVVRALFEQEWVVESIVAAATDGGQPECYLVDVGTEKQQDDEMVASELNDRLQRMSQLRGHGGHGVVRDIVSPLNIIEATKDKYIPENIEDEIIHETDIKTWWLGDDTAYLYEGFRYGTMRRRALAKALPPAAQVLMSGDSLDQVAPRVAGADAVLVTGLGGGFGSGVALDLAQRMDGAGTDVTLFSILPGDGFDDRERERANAHAALSEIEYLALTDDNPFENVVLVPTADDLSDIQEFDEAIAYAMLAHSNLPPNDRMTLNEAQPAGPDQYAPFTIALPQVLRFEVEKVERVLAETTDRLHARQHRLEVELDLYHELADLIVESFPEAHDPVIARMGDDPATPEEAPAEPMDDPFNLPIKEAEHLFWRVDTLVETLGGDLFEILDDDLALYWFQAIEQIRENARDNDCDDPREMLANLVDALRALLDRPVQGELNDSQVGQALHNTIYMELKTVIFRSRILRAAHQMDDALYREAVLRAVDGDHDVPKVPKDLRVRVDELNQCLRNQRKRMEAVEKIRHEVAERIDHRIVVFREETHDAIETLALIARYGDQIEELLDRIETLICDFVARVQSADCKDELPSLSMLDLNLFDELNGLLDELGLDRVNQARLLESADALVDAKAALLGWQRQGILLQFISDWPERYKWAFERIDPELFDIPISDEAEQDFYCDFVGDHIFERPRETIKARQDEVIDYVVRAAEQAVDTSDLNADDFPVSREDHPEIEWADIDESWRMELRDFLSSISASHDPPSAGQVLGELCDPGKIVREAVEDALFTPVDRALDAVQHDVEAIESELDRTKRLEGLVEEYGYEFAMRADDSQFPASGTDLGSVHHAGHYVQRTSVAVEHLLDQPNSLAETDHPRVQAAIENFLDETVYPFQHLDDHVGLAAGDVVGEGNSVPIPYHGHRVIRAHFGTVFSDDGDDLPTDDALAEVANAVGGNENAASRYFGFGNPWEVTAVTFVGGVFLDNLAPITRADGYRSAYEGLRNELGEQIRVHHAHGLDGCDQSLVKSGDDAGLVYRDQMLNVHDHTEMGPVVAAAEDDAVEWILEECVATESFTGRLNSTPADDPKDVD